MKNVPSVTRKLGIPVFTTRYPLMNPTTSAKTSESATPTHMFVVNWKLNIDANSAEVVTATPADRSNSPPIMSSATATVGMPYVELTYRMVASESASRNGGATEKKTR